MSKVIYSCAENELKFFICNYNGNTLGYSLAKAYIATSDLFVHQQILMGKFEIKTMVDLKRKYNYMYR